MVPEGWDRKNLEEVLSIGGGKDYKHLPRGDIPVYGSGGYMLSVSEYLYDGESVCIGRKGTIDKPLFLSGKFWTVDTLFYTHSFKGVVPYYIYQLFQTVNWRALNEASGVPSLSKTIINSIKINFPPLPEQRKIAQILSKWDKAIATTEKLITASQQQKKALMQQLLTGKKRLGYDEGTYTFKKTRYGAIPLDWEYPAIKDIAVQKSEKNRKCLDLPVLSCSKYDGFVDSLKYFKKKVYSNDTSGYRVISKGCFGFPANHIEEGSIGLQNLYEKGIVSPIYVVFQAKENLVENRYLYALLKTEHYRQIFSAATNASVDRRGSLRWKEFSAIHVSLPPLEEQKSIANVLELADKEIELLTKKLSHLQQEKKALMQQLLTGKRRVNVVSLEIAS